MTGHWVIEAKNWNGDFDTKTVDLQQKGTAITGHFKGPNQSGGLDGSINGHHIVFRTKTKHPLTFRGQVQGDTMTGNFHVMGKEGEFHAGGRRLSKWQTRALLSYQLLFSRQLFEQRLQASEDLLGLLFFEREFQHAGGGELAAGFGVHPAH